MFKSKSFKNTALAAAILALPVTGQFEGLRLKAYLDPVGIETICYGETDGVELGQEATAQECRDMLAIRLGWFSYQVGGLVDVPITVETHAALTSFSYNVGIQAFSKSTLLKKLNAGDYKGACNELPRWVYAKGRKLNGLVRRREAEKELCLKGIES